MASSNPPVKNVALDLYFFITKTDGTVIANPGGLASRLCQNGTGKAGAAPTVADSTGGTCKLTIAQADMNFDCVTVKCTSTDSGAIPFIVTLYTAGQNFDAIKTDTGNIGTAGAGLTALGDTRIANLDATVSSRSTYAGGAVASVTAAVTVATNNDKTGYKLSATPSVAMTESYAAKGAAATLEQLLYEIRAHLTEKAIVSTTVTVNKLDGVTPAATYTLDSGTTPTTITRAT